MDIIYCAGGNTRLAKIAIEEGFLYGSRSDDARNLRCNGLIDIEWNNYNWVNHVDTVKKHKPKYAVVPDVINANCLEKYIKMAEEIEDFCERTILVPKVRNIISIIPKKYVIFIHHIAPKYFHILTMPWQLFLNARYLPIFVRSRSHQ